MSYRPDTSRPKPCPRMNADGTCDACRGSRGCISPTEFEMVRIDAPPTGQATTASASSQKCQYPNCGCTSRATCNFNYDRSTTPSSNAAPLDERELRREIGKASVGACNCGSKGGPLRENHAYACRYRALDAAMAFIDQQGAAQAIRQVQQAGLPSMWCDVSQAEFDACSTEKRIVYAPPTTPKEPS